MPCAARQRIRWWTHVVAGCVLALATLPLPARATNAPAQGAAQPALAGLVLDGRDLPVALSLLPASAGESEQVGVEALLLGLGLKPVHLADGGWQAATPLGTARLAPNDVRTRDGVDYVALPLLARSLGIGLQFDSRAAAVVATTNWNLAARRVAPPTEATVIRPEAGVHAPTTSLSYWRTEAYLIHSDGESTGFGAMDVGGGLGNGFWRARYEDDLADNRRLVDYAWVRTDGRQRWLLGHQQVNSHPLLGSMEITGAQMAWTNRPELLYGNRLEEGELVSGRTAPASNIIGTGPIGGVAELRFDGIVVDRVPVALDGRYEFRDIPLSRGASTRVEVALYENGRLGVPVRIEDHSGQASDQLLPQGTMLHYAGIGENGNPLDPDDFRSGTAAFYEARFGVLPGLTLDLTTQHVDGHDYWLAGGVLALGFAGVYTAHVASNGDRRAWQVDGEGFRGNAWWRLLAREEDAGYRTGLDQVSSGSLYERYAEAGWRGEHLSLSMLGRDFDTGGDLGRVRYVKPGVDWYPTAALYFSARPDLTGRYQYNANWSITDRLRAGAYLSFESDRYELEWQLSQRWRALAGRTEFLGRARHSLLFTRDRHAMRDVGLTLAALESEGEFGYLVGADANLFPGVTVRLQARDDPLSPGVGPVLQLSFIADFAVTPEGLTGNRFRRNLGNIGGISGALRVPAGAADAADFGAAGAAVRIDGQRRASVDRNGRFNVEGLAPGVYRVDVDEGELPIEMHLDQRELWVEVRAGVVTAVEFPLAMRVGFGGRVLGADGAPQPALVLVVEDASGAVVGNAQTDAWGYYRIDGLAPGNYRLRTADGAQSRWVELSGQFRFGIDLRLESAVP
jgi:hypothetical protein